MTTIKRKIRIVGNWRQGGPDREWAGNGTVDEHGAVECSADLGDAAYEQIEAQIAAGQAEGSVVVASEDLARDVTYYWNMEGR
jgi:hypothetical protein